MSRDDEIERLQNKIIELQIKIATLENKPTCPKCGGSVSKSTKYPRWYCNQDDGHCGFWVLHKIGIGSKRGDWPGTYFRRTNYDDIGNIDVPQVVGAIGAFRVVCFIGGHEVTEDVYIATIYGDETKSEEWYRDLQQKNIRNKEAKA